MRFHQRSADRQLDLQIAQLFQAVDMRNNGKLTRKQIKGILQTHGRPANAKNELDSFVSESDINAVMRRMDADGDEELSFSDFFAALLPYFIYGELKEKPTRNQQAQQVVKARQKSVNSKRKTINVVMARAKSASAAQRRKPPSGQPNLWQQN